MVSLDNTKNLKGVRIKIFLFFLKIKSYSTAARLVRSVVDITKPVKTIEKNTIILLTDSDNQLFYFI
jgi:hypothetical protein